MKWIYDEYEFDNRISNIAWTISGKYEESMDAVEKRAYPKDVSLYFAVVSGARRKYIDWEIVTKYLISRIRSGYSKEIIFGLVEIVLNKIVEEKVINDRPGIQDIREKAYEEVLKSLHKINNDNLLDKVKYITILQSMGKHPSSDGVTKRLLKDIKSINIDNYIVDILKEIDILYKDYFKDIQESIEEIESSVNIKEKEIKIDFDTLADFMYEELYSDDVLESEIDSLSDGMLVENIGESLSTDVKDLNDRVIYVDEETANSIYSKIEHYYGKSYLSKGEIKKIEIKNSRNIHSGCRIHFTDGVLRTECNNLFQIKLATKQKENNLSKYRDNFKVYKSSIKKLKDNLSRILIEESEDRKIILDSGNIDASRVWRIGRSNNNKVFYKSLDNNKGRYVIDILLDSSGSQSRNQANVAIQAYIISSALTLADIPNRVMGFNSFLDYTILKRFKDYEAPVKDTNNIFEYFCAGNNRDGLAIKSITYDLLKREEENKILIILSDGKPNDIKLGTNRDKAIRDNKAYKGVIAVNDTAKEVRKARESGVLVLGIFTGKENELREERIIYGKDFVYIKDIERISEVISSYLKKIIRN